LTASPNVAPPFRRSSRRLLAAFSLAAMGVTIASSTLSCKLASAADPNVFLAFTRSPCDSRMYRSPPRRSWQFALPVFWLLLAFFANVDTIPATYAILSNEGPPPKFGAPVVMFPVMLVAFAESRRRLPVLVALQPSAHHLPQHPALHPALQAFSGKLVPTGDLGFQRSFWKLLVFLSLRAAVHFHAACRRRPLVERATTAVATTFPTTTVSFTTCLATHVVMPLAPRTVCLSLHLPFSAQRFAWKAAS